ncbi:MAG: hypothetical protein OES84_03760, partial [Kiritimatiellaceae bacterium]|nr:hypothetical protein [Kiritimatiellaceae bacterium]
MTAGNKSKHVDPMAEYREESIKVPVVVTVVVVLLIVAPLIYWILQINAFGIRAADTTKYDALVQVVDSDVQTVDAMLRNDTAELEAILAARKTPVVTLVVPEIVIVDEKTSDPNRTAPLKGELEGIYWSAERPLVGIAGDIYRVGDKVQGYEVVQISKRSAQFRAEDG